MIAVLLDWLLITLVFFSTGKIFIDIYLRFTHKEEEYSILETFFIGLCVTGSIICISSIWFPSGIKIAALLGIISVIYLSLFQRKNILHRIKTKIGSITLFQSILIIACALMLLLFAIVPPQFPDIYYYHIQNIMWNEEFHVVPGLANIEERFGFNSNLFLLSSVFGLRPLFGEFVYGINALCMLLVLVYIIRQARYQKAYLTLLFIIIYVVFFMEYKTHIGCSSADLFPNLLIVFLLFSLLSNPQNFEKKSVLFWLIPIFCVTLKVSTIFICLLSIYLFVILIRKRKYRTVIFIFITGLLIVFPWLIRNVIISGYLIHPYPALDLFSFDWKLPVKYAVESKLYIEAYTISHDATYDTSNYILNMSFLEKIHFWISQHHPLDICITGAGLLFPFVMFIALFRQKSIIKENSILLLVWIVGLSGFVFWLVMAPAVRFGYGFIAIVFTIPIYLLFKNKKTYIGALFINLFLITTVIFLSVLSIRYYMSIKTGALLDREILYKPQSMDTRLQKFPVKTNTYYINGIRFTQPLDGSCYDFPLPCTYDAGNIEMRGSSLQDGFRKKEK